MNELDFVIRNWDDLSDLVTVITGPMIVISVIATFMQIRSQAKISHKEVSFNGLMTFSTRFDANSKYRQSLIERFKAKDLTLNSRSLHTYYAQYWLQVLEEWDFFINGLLPYETFLGWTSHVYAHMAGDQNMYYFESDGQPTLINSRQKFEAIVLNGVYRNHRRFHDFYSGLFYLERQHNTDPFIEKDRRYEVIRTYIDRFMKKNKINKL